MKVLKRSFILLPLFAMILFSCSSDDEPTPDPEPDPVNISILDLSVDEGGGYMNLTIQLELAAAAEEQITANISTNDGTAEANKDYVPFENQTVIFAAGETAKTYEITIAGDMIFEEDEYFEVTIVSVTGPATIDNATATIDLLNDDVMGVQGVEVAPTIDWDALTNLAPGSEAPYNVFNFGQPSNIPNAEYTSVTALGDSITFSPRMSPSGDTILYYGIGFEPGFDFMWDNLAWLSFTLPDDSLSLELKLEIINNDINDLEGKYEIEFYIGSEQGRSGPYFIDPKLRIQG